MLSSTVKWSCEFNPRMTQMKNNFAYRGQIDKKEQLQIQTARKNTKHDKKSRNKNNISS